MTVRTALLLAAVVLAVLACPRPSFRAKGYMLPLAVACFAASFLVGRLT